MSEHTVAAAALLFVVALCVSLSTAMGRNVATGANGVLLFFLVACAVPAPIGALESRVPGVLLGGAAALVAALTIWPQRPRDRLRAALADATDALAGGIGDSGQPPHAGAESLAEPVREAPPARVPSVRVAVGERPTLASSATTHRCASAMDSAARSSYSSAWRSGRSRPVLSPTPSAPWRRSCSRH